MKLSQKELSIIVNKCKRRDLLSQRKIYELFYVKMMSVCYRYARDEDEAKDILQDGFIKVFEKIDNYSFEGSFEGWLRRVIVNTALDSYRKRKRELTLNESIYNEKSSSYEVEEDDELFTVAGMTNDKEQSFSRFQKKQDEFKKYIDGKN